MNDSDILKVISQIQQQSQRQDSLANQLLDLRMAANKLGLYDAADFIAKVIEDKCNDFWFNQNERTR